MKVTVHRKTHFNAAHRLYNRKWNNNRNIQVFGKCSNPHYHGHNYELIVAVTGEINQETGFVIDLKTLKQLIKTNIEDVFDHKNLNEEIPEFKNINTTVENISVVIWNKLRPHINKNLKLAVTLYETPLNYATYSGD